MTHLHSDDHQIRILVVRADAIGDMVVTLPAIYAIKQRYPDCHLTVMASRYNARLITHIPEIDQVIHYEPEKGFLHLVHQLNDQHFDASLHLHDNSKIAWAAFWAHIPVRVGDKSRLSLWPIFRDHGIRFKTVDQTRHMVEYSYDLLKQIDVPADLNTPIRLPIPKTAKTNAAHRLKPATHGVPTIGIQIGTGLNNRALPPETYATYINDLRKHRDVNVLVAGYTDDEVRACYEIQEMCAKPIIVSERDSLSDLIGIIDQLDLFVSVDTGPFHIATAVQTPQLAIFPSKRIKPYRWGAWRNRHLIVRESHACRHFCPHQGCTLPDCIDAISVPNMVSKSLAVLDGAGPTSYSDQLTYWFQHSQSVILLYDTSTKSTASTYAQALKKWDIRVHSMSYTDSHFFKYAAENEVSIVHNLSKKECWRLFIKCQLLSPKLHTPPLLIHSDHVPSSLPEAVQFYKDKFGKKTL